MAPRIYLSSTYIDLEEYRNALYVALRRLGNVVMIETMETMYDNGDSKSHIEKNLMDVKSSDIFILLVGWRYGSIPKGHHFSYTELELRTAKESGIPCLVFFTSEKTGNHVNVSELNDIKRFREYLQENFIVSYFNDSNELSLQVVKSIAQWFELGQKELVPISPGDQISNEILKPDVFLSYAREDIQIAQSISEIIMQERCSVFWDRTIPVGFTWD